MHKTFIEVKVSKRFVYFDILWHFAKTSSMNLLGAAAAEVKKAMEAPTPTNAEEPTKGKDGDFDPTAQMNMQVLLDTNDQKMKMKGH